MSVAERGTCFGYAVHSELTFRYLRGGTGDPMHVSVGSSPYEGTAEPLLDWRPPAHPYEARLFVDGGVYRLWIGKEGWFTVDPAGATIDVPASPDPVRLEERLWGMPALFCFRARGDLPLHAAAVEIDGGAVVLAAPSRHGKTTLAAAFAEVGHRILAEDLSCISARNTLIPGPAMLRIRPDVAGDFALDGADAIRSSERAHVALPPSGRGDCTPLPIRGISFIRPSDGDASLTPVDEAAALRDLWALCFKVPGTNDDERSFARIADLVAAVPVWDLHRPTDLTSLPSVVDAIRAETAGAR